MITCVRELTGSLLAHLPERLNERAQAWLHRKRAGREIAALQTTPAPADHFMWIANGKRFISELEPTAKLLAADDRDATRVVASGWPADLDGRAASVQPNTFSTSSLPARST